MVQLTDEQVALIGKRIATEGVTNTGLINGLLDHYCCFIEEEIDRGNDFDSAYKHAFNVITPNGAYEIQEELFFLLTFKKQTNMKRIIYGSGFLAAFLISMGLMFKIMHWPGASAMLTLGFGALIISSTALLGNALRHTKTHATAYNVRVFVGFLSALLISTGSIFKILQYPTANIQTVLGMSLLNFVFMPMFFYHLYKQSLQQTAKG